MDDKTKKAIRNLIIFTVTKIVLLIVVQELIRRAAEKALQDTTRTERAK